MAKRCTRCGTFMMDDERFCPKCGENAGEVPPQGQDAQYQQYQQPGVYQNGYQGPQSEGGAKMPYVGPAYSSAPQNNNTYAEMSLGKWVGTVILTTCFGIISFVLLLVWGFGEGPEERRRYCKAMLITRIITIVLVIIAYAIFFSIFMSSGVINDIINEIEMAEQGMDYYSSYFNDQITMFFGA